MNFQNTKSRLHIPWNKDKEWVDQFPIAINVHRANLNEQKFSLDIVADRITGGL